MTPEIKNTLIDVLSKAIKVNQLLLLIDHVSKQRNKEIADKQQNLDNAINWVKQQ